MSSAQLTLWVSAAVLLFWTVGAYNRLVRLRNTILRRFWPVDEQFKQRHALLQQQLDALATRLPEAPQILDALRAAMQQADAAHARARAYPCAASVASNLRLAEDILSDTRTRLPPDALAHPDLSDLKTQLAASEATLVFAKRQFNDAAVEYNRALRQFPTWIVVHLFNFRAAGTL